MLFRMLPRYQKAPPTPNTHTHHLLLFHQLLAAILHCPWVLVLPFSAKPAAPGVSPKLILQLMAGLFSHLSHGQYPEGPPGSSRDQAQSCSLSSPQVQGFPGHCLATGTGAKRNFKRRLRGLENGMRGKGSQHVSLIGKRVCWVSEFFLLLFLFFSTSPFYLFFCIFPKSKFSFALSYSF